MATEQSLTDDVIINVDVEIEHYSTVYMGYSYVTGHSFLEVCDYLGLTSGSSNIIISI